MCTVLLRFDPDATWPVLIAAVRDEYLARPWEPPAEHWPGRFGGRDSTAGGTWLAVDPARPSATALLNGFPRCRRSAIAPRVAHSRSHRTHPPTTCCAPSTRSTSSARSPPRSR
ncbi:NRDE family protein [Dactylosporangium darangshiense]|uniref:NRDE family protein n=1 Tax=Dactylosporangium darangshiense TaxID=579108 RepID=UPI0036424DA5